MPAFEIRSLLDSKLLTLGKHYEIERKEENVLGKGGFGVVWRGVDNRNNAAVAIKQVSRNPLTERFIDRELRLMRVCNHPNVIQLYEHFADESAVYFILELCAGNLDEFVKEKDINFPAWLAYTANICSGVKHLHDQSIAHRDIKPENVLVKDNVLKVSDLGLAKEFLVSMSGQSRSGTGGVGTVKWMAPELSTAESRPTYGLAVDIFSLALLLLSLLTHRPGEHLAAHTGMHTACDNF